MEEKERMEDSGAKQGCEKTKYRLAEAVKVCMRTTPVDKITVKNIVEEGHTTRQTFYRNFQDKYALINWYFDKLLLESFDQMGKGKTIYEGLVKKFRYIEKERIFFVGAFRSDDYNSLKEHDFALILQFYTDRITEKRGASPEAGLQFLLEMYCQGSIFMTVKWVLSGMKETPEAMAKLLIDGMPAKLDEVFRELKIL